MNGFVILSPYGSQASGSVVLGFLVPDMLWVGCKTFSRGFVQAAQMWTSGQFIGMEVRCFVTISCREAALLMLHLALQTISDRFTITSGARKFAELSNAELH